jgi:hypothetical protein
MDVHIPRAVADGLRLRGINVLTSQEDGTTETQDPILMDRATELDSLSLMMTTFLRWPQRIRPLASGFVQLSMPGI